MDTLGRLKYRFRSDRGFRANVVQTLVLVTVLSAAGFALHNLAANLANLGKDFSFAFLLARQATTSRSRRSWSTPRGTLT